jgi:hypothetical protein
MCKEPDFDSGVVTVKDGKRRFVRVWPDPVALIEAAPGVWREIENISVDFNLTVLKQARDEFICRYHAGFPDLGDAIKPGRECPAVSAIPPGILKHLMRLDERVRRRELFLSVIPQSILEIVKRFPGKHYALLRALSRHPGLTELLETNPLMGFLAATHPAWRRSTRGEMDALLRMRRRQILLRLGFPHSAEAIVHVTGKVLPWACRADLLPGFCAAMRESRNVRRLSFLRRINLGVMEIIASPGLLETVTNRLLGEVGTDAGEDTVGRAARALRACQDLRTARGGPAIPRVFRTLPALWRFCVRFTEFFSPDEISGLDVDLPKPPIPDTGAIRALRQYQDVADEAREQSNCVWELLPKLASGQLFLYRVLEPERATLSIERKNGKWCVNEIQGPKNEPVREETIAHVTQWLSGSEEETDVTTGETG